MGFRLRPGLWESLNGGVYGSLLEKFQRVGFWAILPSMDVADVYNMKFRQRSTIYAKENTRMDHQVGRKVFLPIGIQESRWPCTDK